NGALLYQNEIDNWHLVTILMNDETSRTEELGWHDDKRMADDYKLVDEYLKLEKYYDIKSAYSNHFLDKNVKMQPINPTTLYSWTERATRRSDYPNAGPTTAKVRAASSKRADDP